MGTAALPSAREDRDPPHPCLECHVVTVSDKAPSRSWTESKIAAGKLLTADDDNHDVQQAVDSLDEGVVAPPGKTIKSAEC